MGPDNLLRGAVSNKIQIRVKEDRGAVRIVSNCWPQREEEMTLTLEEARCLLEELAQVLLALE